MALSLPDWRGRLSDGGERDDGVRGRTGVVVSLVDVPDGRVRLVFDDVERAESSDPRRWDHEFFFTRTELDREAALKVEVSQAELAKIGFAVLARLAAHRKVPG
jgi:hypothetical protein